MDHSIDIKEFHWLMDMLQTIDVGLVVLDRNYQVQVWNSFMESHSGLTPLQVKDKNVFDIFDELPRDWMIHKTNSVFLLKNRSFMTWEQRPYLFRFKNYRPITGTEEFMYQNVTISPLVSANGEVNHIAIIIYDVTDIASNRKALLRANEELEKLSRTDKLTQLNNRGYWEECLTREFSRFNRYNTTTSVVMFDIDHFKKVNDTYGHQAGDEAIKLVANVLRSNLRDTDIAGRYGGEEYGVILPNTDAQAAIVFCERIRKQIEAMHVEHEGRIIKFTISLGISQANKDIPDHKTWLEQADQALYASKEGGRNQTNVFGEY
ncbi:MAG: sensor domain-containing diguanylate cyclase [Oleiphilaceae bacterium]|nr:sensor domain-containing diguanylate cyclase [Oleiphilaceae bacterium]